MRARVRKHLETIVVAGIVGALAAGGPAVAGSIVDFARRAGNSGKVDGIDASRRARAGQLLALDANGKFPASVLPPGAAGPAGPKGDSGPAGPQGARGETGATGARGATGAQGAQGPAGAAGAKGDTGATGETGARGEKGDKGDTGAPGAKGDAGPEGPKGAQGEAGIAGAAGAPGAKGDKGDPGLPGADGARGPAGEKGDKGEPGLPGVNGAPGPAGEKGDKGEPGTKGDRGDPGEKGEKGEKGDKGDTGPAGSAAAYPPIVDVNPVLRPSRANLWGRIQINGESMFNGYRSSFPNGTDESYVEWDVPLQAGTWAIELVYVKSHDAAILNLSLGGTSFSQAIDAFSPEDEGIIHNQVATFTGVDVATTGIHTLRIATPTKNAESAGYFGYLVWIRLVRE